jgi:hypothetical protein
VAVAFRLGSIVQGAQLLTPLAQKASEMWKASQEQRPAGGAVDLEGLGARVKGLEDQIEQRDELDRETVEQIDRHAQLIAQASRRVSVSLTVAWSAFALGLISLVIAIIALVLAA